MVCCLYSSKSSEKIGTFFLFQRLKVSAIIQRVDEEIIIRNLSHFNKFPTFFSGLSSSHFHIKAYCWGHYQIIITFITRCDEQRVASSRWELLSGRIWANQPLESVASEVWRTLEKTLKYNIRVNLLDLRKIIGGFLIVIWNSVFLKQFAKNVNYLSRLNVIMQTQHIVMLWE